MYDVDEGTTRGLPMQLHCGQDLVAAIATKIQTWCQPISVSDEAGLLKIH